MWKILRVLIFLIRDCIIYFLFFSKNSWKISSPVKPLLLSPYIHPRTQWKVPRDISNLDPFHVTIPSHCNSSPLPLSRDFKNHSSKFRENLYSSVSHVPHTHITFSFATNIIATRLRRKYEFIQLSFLVFDTFEAANLH